MLAVVRPGLALIARRIGSDAMLVVVTAAAITSAVIADAIGIGYIIGAFTAGAIVPDAVRASLITRIEPLAASVLLPFFFVVTGLRAFIDPASGVFAGILAATTAATLTGKVAGTAIPARLTGTPWREALALGCLMQTKGLMEVLVLSILADAGVIGHTSKALISACFRRRMIWSRASSARGIFSPTRSWRMRSSMEGVSSASAFMPGSPAPVGGRRRRRTPTAAA